MPSLDRLITEWVPTWRAVVCGGPLFLAWSVICLEMAACSKRRWDLATGYSRKLFHISTFATACVAQAIGGLPFVCLFGAMSTLVVAHAVLRGPGHRLYEALAREGDAPYRTHYVVVSYLATLVGGVASNLVAGRLALLGYLVCGLGDAAGEPVGTRWGRHWYAVPTRAGSAARRSLEGSAAVFGMSLVALMVGAGLLFGVGRVVGLLPPLMAIAALSTLVEAVSPHGWDNATLQIAPPLLAMLLLGS